MITKMFFIISFLSFIGTTSAQAQFEKYFLDKTLRFDYYHCGTHNTEELDFQTLVA